MEPSFWTTVVTNAAPIIIAMTGFGAMVGGFYMQYRMMKQQNRKLDANANEATAARRKIDTKMDQVVEATNGLVDKKVVLARELGRIEGAHQERERNGNGTP